MTSMNSSVSSFPHFFLGTTIQFETNLPWGVPFGPTFKCIQLRGFPDPTLFLVTRHRSLPLQMPKCLETQQLRLSLWNRLSRIKILESARQILFMKIMRKDENGHGRLSKSQGFIFKKWPRYTIYGSFRIFTTEAPVGSGVNLRWSPQNRAPIRWPQDRRSDLKGLKVGPVHLVDKSSFWILLGIYIGHDVYIYHISITIYISPVCIMYIYKYIYMCIHISIYIYSI